MLGGIASSQDKDKAVVAISYRLVDAETSEVIATGEARGESIRKSAGFGGMARPAGVYVIRGQEVAWEPSLDVTLIALAGIVWRDCFVALCAPRNDNF